MSADRSASAYADKKEETFAAWKTGIAELGKCQNVVVKLGGLGMLFGMYDFHTRETPPSSEELARAYKRYIETCILAFGPDRGMFESNFPSDGVSEAMPSCGTRLNSWPPATRLTKRRSCSTGGSLCQMRYAS
jgi:predicted TIM-barrel fold metal-dependent hydrolase